jgi:hypothetical protein
LTLSRPETNVFAPLAIDESRRMLLDAIGSAPEMTLIRPFGNHGDELIWAGTRELLSGHVYREIGIDQLASSSGELGVLSGGGAWSRRYNEFMPEALAIAEQRFERVIVLPSTFEVSEDRVRAALENTKAIVFARERESFGQIQGLCRAKLAHDCAFFADLGAYAAPGEGELNAFRTDDESLGLQPVPPDNEDISETADSLESWLRTIERHAVINTDRAHVMIAGALMGKQVNFAPSSYFKVEAIAEFALGEYNVQPLAGSDGHAHVVIPSAATAPLGVAHPDLPARVTVAVLSRDHDQSVGAAIDSVADDAQVLVLDRNSRPKTREVLKQVAERTPAADLKLANRDSGVAASMRLAAELADTEYVMFLGDQQRLTPGSIEKLVAALDADPGAVAIAAAEVVDGADDSSCGGWLVVDSSTVAIEPSYGGASGITGWVPSQGTLFRRESLTELPFADGLDLLTQNVDWCLRVEQFAPGSLRRCPGASVISAAETSRLNGPSLVARASAVRPLPAHAEFFSLHGRLLRAHLLDLVPELADRDGRLKSSAAKLLLNLVSARGPEWTLMEWMNGGLDPLLQWQPVEEEPELSEAQRERSEWLEARNERLVGIENGGWWKLRERLRPLMKLVGR